MARSQFDNQLQYGVNLLQKLWFTTMYHDLNYLDELVDTWLLMTLLGDNSYEDYTLQEKKNEHLSS